MSTIVIYFCLIYLLFFCAIIALPFVKYTKLQIKFLLIGEVLSLSLIAFCWEPMANDLTRHFELLDRLRDTDMGLLEFLFNPEIAGSSYESLVSFNVFRYILVRSTANNHFYPFVAVLIDYSIIAYITFDWHFNELKDGRVNLLEFIMCLTFMPFLYSCQGIRNALAACVMALGVYCYFCKKKNWGWIIIMTFIAATIHPVVLLTIPCLVVVEMNIKKQWYVCFFLVPILFSQMAKLFIDSSYEYVRRIATYYIHYTSGSQYRAAMYYLYADIALIFIIYVSYIAINKMSEKKVNDKKIILFVIAYMLIIMGFVGNYDMILRPAYFLGAFSPVVSSIITDKNAWGKRQLMRCVGNYICILIGSYIILRYMRFYFSWSYNIL